MLDDALEAYSNRCAYSNTSAGGVLTFKSYEHDFGYTDSTTVSAVMVSLQNAAAFIAALGVFPISERFGRKITIQVAMVLFCIGVILQVVPSHSLVCVRIVMGDAHGAV